MNLRWLQTVLLRPITRQAYPLTRALSRIRGSDAQVGDDTWMALVSAASFTSSLLFPACLPGFKCTCRWRFYLLITCGHWLNADFPLQLCQSPRSGGGDPRSDINKVGIVALNCRPLTRGLLHRADGCPVWQVARWSSRWQAQMPSVYAPDFAIGFAHFTTID